MEMEMEMDRLSLLPDDLLIHILRFLYLEEEAAKTSLLSKRWRYLWTNLRTFWFEEKTDEIEAVNKFKARVHGVLASRRGGAALDFLGIRFFYDKTFDSDIDVWVALASKNGVRKFFLHLSDRIGSYNQMYAMPEIIYSNPQLMSLKLQYCIMPPPTSAVEWRSITYIELESCILPQQVIDKITSACIALTHMELAYCDGFNRLEIGCQSFRKLSVSGSKYLEISVQYMTDLSIVINLNSETVHLTDVASLERVRLHVFDFDVELVSPELLNNARQIFRSISRVNTIVFVYEALKAISKIAMMGLQLPQLKAEKMEIIVYDDVADIYGAITLLQSSPFLKELIMRGCDYKFREEPVDWDLTTEFDLRCDLPHLQTLIITIFAKCHYISTFTLAKAILERAPSLEEMQIHISMCGLPSSSVDNEVINTFQTLLSYPKPSVKSNIYCVS